MVCVYLLVPRRSARLDSVSQSRINEQLLSLHAQTQLNTYLEKLALPHWHPGKGKLLFWDDGTRTAAKGYICGFLLLREPGVRIRCALDACSAESRLMVELVHGCKVEFLASFEVVGAYSMSSFANDALAGCYQVDDARLLPMSFRRWYQPLSSNFRKEVLPLTVTSQETLRQVPCFQGTCLVGTVDDVCRTHGCLPGALAIQLPAVFEVLLLRQAWSSIVIPCQVPWEPLGLKNPPPK